MVPSILKPIMHATLVYPHQLFKAPQPHLDPARPVYLVEESLFITEFPTHVQKQLLHHLSLQAYGNELEAAGYQVHYCDVMSYPHTEAVFVALAEQGVTTIHCVDTTDDWLERRIDLYTHRHGIERVRYESPLFILSKADALARFQTSKKFMATFYKKMRQDFGILLEEDGTPTGGAWSFDSENRQKLPKNIQLPDDIALIENAAVTEALAWQTTLPGEHYGVAQVWVPYTRADAQKIRKEFLGVRVHQLGPIEYAIDTDHARRVPSTHSPLINIGLLEPRGVVNAAITYAKEHDIPLPSLEGFVRQIIGWREFIRASYEADGRTMRRQNFWQHTKQLSPAYWTGDTGVFPVDRAITRALQFGYTHHIERLMVMGNFMLLSGLHPDEVYRWFMGMYVDAYDWVMVPNVYGMSQFADGGSFATKPYISGASYIKKMSNYPKGDWEDIWTALYWNFIHTHVTVFQKNHRLAMMPKLLEKMDATKKAAHLKLAAAFLRQQ